ncbi:hypothetical protein GOP47_0029323 [Adiantum capillus-veneris]|nr:hypothetical protein GOP47_0029323 [Adiantum capillus-veneris]
MAECEVARAANDGGGLDGLGRGNALSHQAEGVLVGAIVVVESLAEAEREPVVATVAVPALHQQVGGVGEGGRLAHAIVECAEDELLGDGWSSRWDWPT